MQRDVYALATCVALFGSLGCGGGAAGDAARAPDDGEPTDAATAMKREMAPLEKQPVASKDQGWKAEVEGVSPPKVIRQDDRVSVTVDLGLEAPLECSVFDEMIDVGSSVTSVLAAIRQNLEIKLVGPYSFQMIESEPAMFVRAVYATDVDGKQRVGDLKFMVSPRQDHSYVCSLDVPGYPDSFVRVASDFGRSFQYKSSAPKYQREEVWKINLGEVPVGFTASRIIPGKKNLFTSITLSTMLIPASPEELSTQDEATIILRDAKGTVIQGKWLSIENVDTALEIELVGGPGKYQYSGSFKGKAVSGNVAATKLYEGQVPLTEYAKRISRGQKVKPLELSEYHPGLDPTKGIVVRYTGTPREDGATVTEELGSIKLDFETDKDGTARSLSTSMAGASMTGELVYEQGKL